MSKRETLANKLAAMQTEIGDSDTTISTHYRAALNGGWTATELAAAGLDMPKAATRKRAPKPRQHTTTPEAPVSDAAPEADALAA